MINDRFFLDPTCKLYLPFHLLDGASFASREQYGHIVTNHGAVRRLNSMYFDGNNDYLEVAADELNFTSEDFSYIVGMKYEDLAAANTIIDRHLDNVSGYFHYVTTLGRVEFATHQAGAVQKTLTANGDIEEGKEYQIGVRRFGTSVRIYINGKDKTETAVAHIDPVSHAGNLMIGSLQPAGVAWSQGELKYLAAYGEAKPGIWFQRMYEEARLR